MMSLTSREIEKLKAIGYKVSRVSQRGIYSVSGYNVLSDGFFKTEIEAWDHCKVHSQSVEGSKATMAAKLQWLTLAGGGYRSVEIWWEEQADFTGWFAWVTSELVGSGPSPEIAVDVLYCLVP